MCSDPRLRGGAYAEYALHRSRRLRTNASFTRSRSNEGSASVPLVDEPASEGADSPATGGDLAAGVASAGSIELIVRTVDLYGASGCVREVARLASDATASLCTRQHAAPAHAHADSLLIFLDIAWYKMMSRRVCKNYSKLHGRHRHECR